MKIKFLATSEDGFLWMTRYYARVFPAGRQNGLRQFQKAKDLLRSNPLGGHKFDDFEAVRELRITNTPFLFIYTITDTTIYVIDIRDQRGFRIVAGLERFSRSEK